MKNYRHYIYCVLFAVIAISCEDSYESDAGSPGLPLTAATNIKSPGRGQYSMNALTGQEVEITATLPAGTKSLTITKTVNLENDATYGTGGVLTVTPSGSEYQFVYVPVEADLDQLIGFTFRAESGDGSIQSSDLTLNVTLSPRDNLPKRKWLFKSKIYVDAGNAEDIRECEKDNYIYFNEDGTVTNDYGANTGTGDCGFDGFNVYDSWELSEDEKTFTMVYHNLFNPAQITTDVYRVNVLTTDRLELEIDIDLSWLGPPYTTEETFIYKYSAERK